MRYSFLVDGGYPSPLLQILKLKTMKKVISILTVLILIQTCVWAQSKQKLLVMPVDVIGVSSSYTSFNQYSGIVRLYAEKNMPYTLIDRYEMELAKLSPDSIKRRCKTNSCLIEYGKKLKADKVLFGYVESLGRKYIVSLQLQNVSNAEIEKNVIKEFLPIEAEIGRMIEVTLNEMNGIANDTEVVTKLTKKDDYENSVNNPYQLRLKADGPRMGFTLFTGESAQILQEKNALGGYEVNPVLFQFGYQFEKQYLNEGNFQALAEFIPMVTGFDQGLFIPGFTLMNGIRSNKSGWEIAFGPSFSAIKKANVYFDENQWKLANESMPEDAIVERRLDSRGVLELNTSFVIAAGKTIKSGKLNLPLNVYVVPGRNGVRYGISFGFNSRSRYN